MNTELAMVGSPMIGLKPLITAFPYRRPTISGQWSTGERVMHRAVVARANGASRPSSKLSRRGRLGVHLLPQALAVRTLVSRALHCISSASTGLLVALVFCARIASAQNASEPGLPSWNDGPARRAIVH